MKEFETWIIKELNEYKLNNPDDPDDPENEDWTFRKTGHHIGNNATAVLPREIAKKISDIETVESVEEIGGQVILF